MAIRFISPTPLIGSTGVFELNTPFTTLPNERCQCVAIRRISSWISNNDDPWTEVYQPAKLSEAEYEDAKAIDLELVTLINDRGMRIVVPATYILKYPVQDGVPYRRMGIHIALPPMPEAQSLDFLEVALRETVMAMAGVRSDTRQIQTSAVQMISPDQHELVSMERDAAIGANVTDYAKNQKLMADLEAARGKIQQLEAYILATNNGP